MMEKKSDIIEAAADRVMEGWCQYAAKDLKGNVCLYGALTEVMRGDWSTESLETTGDVLDTEAVKRYPRAAHRPTRVETTAVPVVKAMEWDYRDLTGTDPFPYEPDVHYEERTIVGQPLRPAAYFNDHVAKSKEEVYDFMMDVAKELRGRGE